MTEYRAISLHQPWASLVALGIKKYETRSWSTKYRGKLLICSTQAHSVTVGLMKDADLVWAEYPSLYPEDMTNATEPQKQLVKMLGWSWKENISLYHAKLCDYAKPSKYFDKGKVLCVVDLANCHPMILNSVVPTDLERICGNWTPDRYALELVNLMPLPEPIPIKGKQGLWIPDSSMIQEVERQLSVG